MHPLQRHKLEVQQDTLKMLEARGGGPKPWFAYVSSRTPLPRTPYKSVDPAAVLPRGPCHNIRVLEMDTLVAAAACLHEGAAQVGVLNMASATHPGGGYKFGASAQEEDLCRRTDMVPVLEAASAGGLYPIPLLGTLVIPGVDVLKGPRPGYGRLKTEFQVGVLVAAALDTPRIDPATRQLGAGDTATTIEKIRQVLACALLHGYKTVVLGAWGCGAYRNPPAHIARLFRQVLEEEGAGFDAIVFAVLGDGNPGVFAAVFADPDSTEDV